VAGFIGSGGGGGREGERATVLRNGEAVRHPEAGAGGLRVAVTTRRADGT